MAGMGRGRNARNIIRGLNINEKLGNDFGWVWVGDGYMIEQEKPGDCPHINRPHINPNGPPFVPVPTLIFGKSITVVYVWCYDRTAITFFNLHYKWTDLHIN